MGKEKSEGIRLAMSAMLMLTLCLPGQSAEAVEPGISSSQPTQLIDENQSSISDSGDNVTGDELDESAAIPSEELSDENTEGSMPPIAELVGNGDPMEQKPESGVEFQRNLSTSSALAEVPSLAAISSVLNNDMVCDIYGGSSVGGARLQLYSENASSAQRFRIEEMGDGYYTIVNVGSGKVLDVSNGSTLPGTPVQQWGSNGTDAQKWKFLDAGDGACYLVSKLGDNLVLDIPGAWGQHGAGLQVYTANGSDAQRFTLKGISPVVEEGTYTIGSGVGSTVLDVPGASNLSGIGIQTYEQNATAAQSFSLAYDESTGYYTIRTFSGKLLDVEGASGENGARVQQYDNNGTRAQKWAIERCDNGFVLRSACGGAALDVAGASDASGARVQVYEVNGTIAQIWKFNKSKSTLASGLYGLFSSINVSFALDVANGSNADGANVQLYSSNNTWAQKWTVQVGDDGYCVIYSLQSGKVLDVCGAGIAPGTNVQQYTYNGSDAQFWEPVYYGGSGYGFRSKCNGLFLDVDGGNAANGTNVQVWQGNDTPAQRFNMSAADRSSSIAEGSYSIMSISSGMPFDVTGASKDNGVALQLHASNGTYAQKFQILSSGFGIYNLVNIHSSKYVDVDTNTKSRIQQWDKNGDSNQQWAFFPVDANRKAYYIKSIFTGQFLTYSSQEGLAFSDYVGTVDQQFSLERTTAFKVYLDAGHGYNSNGDGSIDAGACSLWYRECDLTSDLVSRIAAELDSRGIEYYVGYGEAYWDRHQNAVEMGCTTFLSIHFNAGGGTGVESYIHSYNASSGSPTYQSIIHPYMVAGTTLVNRGMKSAALAVCGGRLPSTLLEIAFIDNAVDMATYESRKNDVARFLAAGLEQASHNSTCSWN